MKTKKHYPLWLLNLRYSKFLNLYPTDGLIYLVTNWKNLKTNFDGDLILSKRRSLLYRIDIIHIMCNDNCYYRISKTFKNDRLWKLFRNFEQYRKVNK